MVQRKISDLGVHVTLKVPSKLAEIAILHPRSDDQFPAKDFLNF